MKENYCVFGEGYCEWCVNCPINYTVEKIEQDNG